MQDSLTISVILHIVEHASLLVSGMGFKPDYQPSASSTTPMPTEGGQKLGGSKAGKSRLLGDAGRRLGGGKETAPSSLRDAMAQAAESRQRQLQQARRLTERSREPCVIEIYDSDEEEGEATTEPFRHATRARLNQIDCIDLTTATNTKAGEALRVLTDQKAAARKRSSWIDLTSDDEEPAVESKRKSSKADEWICSRCTLKNKPLALVCDACLLERNKI